MLNRLIAPPIKDAVHFDLHLKHYQQFTLRNGVSVYAIDAGVEEVMQIELVFYAGNWFEPQPLVAAATNSQLKNGTRTKTAFEINEHFEYHGAFFSKNCYNETASLTLHALNKHLPNLLPLMRELITEATFPEQELAIYKQNNQQRLLVNLQKSDFVAARMLDAYVYGEQHPYGKYSKAEQYDALTVDLLRAHYQQYYANGQCVLFVAGKLPANLEQLLDGHFGDLPLRSATPMTTGGVPHWPTSPAAAQQYRLQVDAKGVQGAIRIGRPAPGRRHPDFIKLLILNNIFGGYFGSRLMSNIREDKGYTYGISSYLQNHIQETMLVVATEAGVDVCEAAIAEIYKEMDLLRNELVDDEELQLVRNYMIGTILGDLDGPFHIIGRWKNIILNGLDETYFYNNMHAIKTTTAEELRELANKYLNPADFYEVLAI
jgi:zinc protease